MADAAAILVDSFHRRLDELLTRHGRLLDKVEAPDADDLGRRAAETALAPLIWAQAVGERWDTTEVAEFLGITRQALHERVKRTTVLGVPGRGVTWFPTWQFDLAARRVHPTIADVLRVFRDMDDPMAPVEVAAWARRLRPELNDTPADWIAAGKAAEPVLAAARRTAAHQAA